MVKNAKIFWMSDIHYCHDENNKSKSLNDKVKDSSRKNIIASYFDSIKNRIISEKPTHIVITGDLAFSGEYEQYKGMYNMLLKDYLNSEDGIEARLIICCGNHSCNRSIIHDPNFKPDFLKALDGKDLSKYSDKLSVLNELEKIELDIHRFTDVAKQSVNHGSKLLNKLIEGDVIPKLKASELLFIGYRDFYHDYVQTRFDSINESDPNSNKIIQYEIDNNQGLYGVIHDREYNIIFTVLNSSWLAWGNETYDKLLSNPDSKAEFNEYGNLTYKIDVLGKIQKILTEDLKSQLEYNNYICLSHHPFSWMSYDDNYVDNSLNEILELQDILLTGHVHVPHSAPTLYKGKTHWIEAPQIFDYHLYDNQIQASDQYKYLAENHGFSILDLSRGLQSWIWKAFSLSRVVKNSRDIHPFAIGEIPSWQECINKEYEISNRKIPIPNINDLVKKTQSDLNWNEYFNFCKYQASARSAQADISSFLKINKSNCYVCLNSYLESQSYHSSFADLAYRDRINHARYDSKFKLLFDDDVTAIFLTLDFNFYQEYMQLIDFIVDILKKNTPNIKIMNILFFDFQLIEYFCVDFKSIDINDLDRLIANWFDRIKKAVVDKCADIDISGISFDERVIRLPQYLKHIRS